MKSDNIKKSFCAVPWKEPFITPNGNYSLCCLELEVEKQEKVYVNDDFKNHWNSEYMKNIRKNMLAGHLPKECSVCARHENVTKDSLRQRRNLRYLGQLEPDHSNKKLAMIIEQTDTDGKIKACDLEGVQFSVGKICQLGCVSCSPSNSSYLEQEYKLMDLSKSYKDRHNKKEFEKVLNQEIFDEYFYNFLKKNIKEITHLHATGGEPFLSKTFFKFISWCVEHNHTEKNLHIQTNGVTMPLENELENLKKFKEVNLYISCDAVGELEEYVRYPTRWNKKDEYIRKFKTYFSNVTLNVTVHSLNLIGIIDLISYGLSNDLKITLNLLEEPKFLHVKNMLPEIKTSMCGKIMALKLENNMRSPWLTAQIQSICNSLQLSQNLKEYEQLKNMTEIYKKFRKKDYIDIIKLYDFKNF